MMNRKSFGTCLGATALVVLAGACGGDDTPASVPSATVDGGTEDSATSVTPSTARTGVIQVSTPSGTSTGEDGTAVTFTVKLSEKPAAPVSFSVSVSNAAEASSSASVLTFTPDNFGAPQTVTVTGKDDDVVDGDQSVVVVFSAAASTDERYAGAVAAPVALTNMDNDKAGLFISPPVGGTKTNEWGGAISVDVRLRTKPGGSVTVPVASTNEAEGKASTALLTFSPDNYFVAQTVSITGQADATRDIDTAYSVLFGKSDSSDAAYKNLDGKVDLTNTDDSPVEVATSWNAGCARFTSGRMKCWGRNSYNWGIWNNVGGHRGDAPDEMGATLPFANLPAGRTVKHIEGALNGDGSFCAVFDNDTLACWGIGAWGRMGNGSQNAHGNNVLHWGDAMNIIDLGAGVKVKSVSAGHHDICVITGDDKVKCWGHNDWGQLGYGDTNRRGDDPGEMGDALLYVDLGAGRTAKSVSCGHHHTCALLDNNTVKCWGHNNQGQLGQGDNVQRGDGAGEMGDALLAVDLGAGRTAKAVSAGLRHTCAILDNNTLKCWGENNNGELGQGDGTYRGNGMNQMGDNLLPIDLGAGRTAKLVSAGWDQTCAVLDDDTLKCWGYNGYGISGQGDNTQRGDGAGEMGDALPIVPLGAGRKVTTIDRGVNSACVMLDNFQIKCWGRGDVGLHGQGDSEHRGDGAGEMGDNLMPVLLQ